MDACDAVAKDTANQYETPSVTQGHRGTSKEDLSEETGHGDAYADDDY